MAWEVVGEVSVLPSQDEAEIGAIVVPTVGGLVFSIRQIEPTPFLWGSGLVAFRSEHGRELGSLQVWPKAEREVYYLGPGLTVQSTEGVLIFEPRPWNLRWVTAGFPLVLEIEADL